MGWAEVGGTYELPPDIPEFRGRETETQRLVDLLTDESRVSDRPVVNIYGGKGVGKTALAIHAAHQLQESYPDGALFFQAGPVVFDSEWRDFMDFVAVRLGFGGAESLGFGYAMALKNCSILIVLDAAVNDVLWELVPSRRPDRVPMAAGVVVTSPGQRENVDEFIELGPLSSPV